MDRVKYIELLDANVAYGTIGVGAPCVVNPDCVETWDEVSVYAHPMGLSIHLRDEGSDAIELTYNGRYLIRW